MREKLIEILGQADDCNAKFCENCEFIDKVEGCVRRQKEILADHLIANGVTIQKWIPVSERLPEPGDYVLVCDTKEDWYGLWEFSGAAWYDAGYKPWDIDEVTHWMPLPEPPKEGE